MGNLRGFGPKLYPSIGSKRTSDAPSTSRSTSRVSRPPRDNLIKRFARHMWSNKEPQCSGHEVPCVEITGTESTTSSEVDASLALGSLLRVLTQLLVDGEREALLYLLDSMESSALANTELPLSRSEFKKQFLSKRMVGLGKTVFDVVRNSAQSSGSRDGLQPDYSRSEASADPPVPPKVVTPPKVVIPMRCSILRLCRGTGSATQHTGFTSIFPGPDPDPEANWIPRKASKDRQGSACNSHNSSAPAWHRQVPPFLAPQDQPRRGDRRARSATLPKEQGEKALGPEIFRPCGAGPAVLSQPGPSGSAKVVTSHGSASAMDMAVRGARARPPEEEAEEDAEKEHKVAVPGRLPPNGDDDQCKP